MKKFKIIILEKLEGGFIDDFNKLGVYAKELRDTNPGSDVTLRVPTNPEGAQALSKEFPTSAPRVMGRLKDLEEQANGDLGYEVVEGIDRHVVSLASKRYICRTWNLTRIPCPHAIKVFQRMRYTSDSKKSKSPPDVPLSAPQPMVEAAAPSRALVQKPVAPLRALVDEDEIEDELEGWMSSLC
ncbi:hypothetical protein T459_14730 [Capsicum annuum]|uniref:Zinc finger PMZ-type domain-containing protein n=1 Tax=Capsicum annuum TaxID=4072 RepID=A0A2G2ZIG5_CAPAN|nr:hypothetical protein T459_14730 [Capsicum annuum]